TDDKRLLHRAERDTSVLFQKERNGENQGMETVGYTMDEFLSSKRLICHQLKSTT
ncbi:hypothetical protein STEG23_036567, partial [Scotinomys teguina]